MQKTSEVEKCNSDLVTYIESAALEPLANGPESLMRKYHLPLIAKLESIKSPTKMK